MSKQKLMKTIGIVMVVVGIGIGAFGIGMRSVWKVSSQIPKVYDWNTENLGEAPDVDNKDVNVDEGQPSVGENSIDGLEDNQGGDTGAESGGQDEGATDDGQEGAESNE